MFLRRRYPFDQPDETDCKYVHLLATSADERTWWLRGGARGGVHILAHFAGDGNIYTAPRLHATVLAQSQNEDSVRELLRYAANLYAEHGSVIRAIEEPSVLPAFTWHDVARKWIHQSTDWYTNTERVLRLAPPWWAPDAQVFDIREGVYLYFPDGTYRLCRRRDYYALESCHYPLSRTLLARQGDLLFMATGDCLPIRKVFAGWDGSSMQTQLLGDHDSVYLGRHHIDVGQGLVTHPEHGSMGLPADSWLAIIAPGTSRPFSWRR